MSIPVRKPDFHEALSFANERRQRPHANPTALVVVGLLTLAYIALFGWLSLRRYWGYQMHALDMGNMGQAAWNTLHGHPFFFTNVRLPWNIEAWNTTTRLSFHVEPIFPLISLSYLVHPGPESLIVLQTVALGLGAVPVYLLAVDLVGSAALGIAFALVCLLFPTLEGMNLYEFHPVALATPLLLAAFLFAYRRQWTPFVICAVLATGTKEEIGLVVALLGVFVAIRLGARRVGWPLAAFGVTWSLSAVLVIEHHYRQPGTLTYVHTRYGYLGHGLRGAVNTVLHNPGAIGNVLFIAPKLAYFRLLLVPVGFLALLAPEILVIAAPTLLLNLFSTEFHMFTGVGQDSAEIISIVLVAAIVGASRLQTALERVFTKRQARVGLLLYLVIVAVLSQRSFGYTPVGAEYSLAPVGAHQRIEDRFVAMVPAGVPVATQDQLDPHLSSRHFLYLFGDTGREPRLVPANDVLLDVSAPLYAYRPDDIYARAMTLLRHGWGVVAADDGLIYLRKGAPRTTIPGRFYSYTRVKAPRPEHPVGARIGSLSFVGYDLARTDQPNHRIPNLQYRVYFRVLKHTGRNLAPVIFERMSGHTLTCVAATGLDWLPTSRWSVGQTYAVNMQTLQTDSLSPGAAHLQMAMAPMAAHDCTTMWRSDERLFDMGRLTISW